MNINIPNAVIWSNAYKVILAIAILIACFSADAATNIGRLFTISLMSVGAAHFLFKKKSEYAQSLAKAVAALIPVFVAISFITSDKIAKDAIATMNESLAEQKNTYQKTIDGTYTLADANKSPNQPVSMDEFKRFKAASSKDEMLKEMPEVLKLATRQSSYIIALQAKGIADINLTEAMQTENLANIAGAQRLKSAGQKYAALIAQMKASSTEFNAQYKATFYLIAANYPAELPAFDKSFNESVKNQNAMYVVENELAIELQKLADILITAYKNQQVKYDPGQKALLFLNDPLMNSYNASIEKITDLAKQEDEISQRFIASLSKYEKTPAKK
jgi:hypothetical protein